MLMKSVKFLSFALFCMLICMLSSCSSNGEEPVTPPAGDDEWMEVSLKFSKERVSVFDEPLSRAEGEEMYLIVVSEYENSKSSDHAYGIFNTVDDLKLKVKKHKTYKIMTIMIYDYFDSYNFGENYKSATNKFEYGNMPSDLVYPTRNLFANETYFCNSDFDPSENTSCTIELKRASYDIKLEAQDLDEGKIECIIGTPSNFNGEETIKLELLPSKSTVESPITFWSHISNPQTITLPVTINYIDGEGNSTEIVSEDYAFTYGKRKCFLLKGSVEASLGFTKAALTIVNEDPVILEFN